MEVNRLLISKLNKRVEQSKMFISYDGGTVGPTGAGAAKISFSDVHIIMTS